MPSPIRVIPCALAKDSLLLPPSPTDTRSPEDPTPLKDFITILEKKETR